MNRKFRNGSFAEVSVGPERGPLCAGYVRRVKYWLQFIKKAPPGGRQG